MTGKTTKVRIQRCTAYHTQPDGSWAWSQWYTTDDTPCPEHGVDFFVEDE
jgi:hypothetical protein